LYVYDTIFRNRVFLIFTGMKVSNLMELMGVFQNSLPKIHLKVNYLHYGVGKFVLMTSPSVPLQRRFMFCDKGTVCTYKARIFATFPFQVMLEASFSTINIATSGTRMRLWCSHFRALLTQNFLIITTLCRNLMESMTKFRIR
jgi:hypothetical protein